MKWLKSTNCIMFNIVEKVASITLNRPTRRNALSNELLVELESALWEADDRRDVSVITLEGAGQDFCSGYDMKALKSYAAEDTDAPSDYDASLYRGNSSYDDDTWALERAQSHLLAAFDVHKPVIAKVHGHCIAGGTDLALYCDMIIAADDSKIGFPATRVQGSPPSHMWLYHLGPQWTKRVLMTGDLLSGKDAAKLGLVMKSVPFGKLDAEVNKLARRLTLVDPDLLACQKRITNLGLELMGARVLQRAASETDARGHLTASRRTFQNKVRELGLKEAFRARDEPFGTPMVELE
jgi:enoyl-CoA hydratase